MKKTVPDFLRDFHCIASACQDTCCAGWEIEVDSVSAEYYRSIPGAFGEELRKRLETEEGEDFFRLTRQRRCPFLDEQNLCRIYQNLGEEALCDICTEHPRFYNWLGADTEEGLGLCCEEVRRLLFTHPEPIRFETEELEASGEEEDEDPFLPLLLKIREAGFSLLQDRSVSVAQRLIRLEVFLMEMQDLLDQGQELTEVQIQKAFAACRQQTYQKDPLSEEELTDILDVCLKLEYLGTELPDVLRRIRERLPELQVSGDALLERRSEQEYEWEHLSVYYLYRYLVEALYDWDLALRLQFLLLHIRLLTMLIAEANAGDSADWLPRAQLVGLYSKEIEYCPENVETLYEAIQEGRILL